MLLFIQSYNFLSDSWKEKKKKNLTERKKKSLCWFVIFHAPLIWLGWEREFVTIVTTLEILFNILIENDKHSGKFGSAGTLKNWSSVKDSSMDQAYPISPQLINTWLLLIGFSADIFTSSFQHSIK